MSVIWRNIVVGSCSIQEQKLEIFSHNAKLEQRAHMDGEDAEVLEESITDLLDTVFQFVQATKSKNAEISRIFRVWKQYLGAHLGIEYEKELPH